MFRHPETLQCDAPYALAPARSSQVFHKQLGEDLCLVSLPASMNPANRVRSSRGIGNPKLNLAIGFSRPLACGRLATLAAGRQRRFGASICRYRGHPLRWTARPRPCTREVCERLNARIVPDFSQQEPPRLRSPVCDTSLSLTSESNQIRALQGRLHCASVSQRVLCATGQNLSICCEVHFRG
jgi:hypothetical protein